VTQPSSYVMRMCPLSVGIRHLRANQWCLSRGKGTTTFCIQEWAVDRNGFKKKKTPPFRHLPGKNSLKLQIGKNARHAASASAYSIFGSNREGETPADSKGKKVADKQLGAKKNSPGGRFRRRKWVRDWTGKPHWGERDVGTGCSSDRIT